MSTENVFPSSESDLGAYCTDLGRRARAAERRLRLVRGAQKNDWLIRSALALEAATEELLAANARDLAAAEAQGLSAALVDRLRLTPGRIKGMVDGLRAVAALPDPIGKVLDSSVRPNGLAVTKVAVPLGVVLFIYEARPNVTTDAAALCVKSGNALILRGGKEAFHSNVALHRLLQDGLREAGLPPDAVQMVAVPQREAVSHLLRLRESIDLVIPRGGESLIRRVEEEATMHVLRHYKGNCHVYVDAGADLEMAARITLNAKCQRPGVCNAAESLLIHTAVAPEFLGRVGPVLRDAGVELRGCPRTVELLRTRGVEARSATEEDHAAEFLDLILSVKVVKNLDEAIDHIARYGSGHTECIITNDLPAACRFTAAVDSSAVLVNASTRFNDGGELGLGAEIGISTDKFHARGPCGLLELTCYKYVVHGDGQVRG
jgi:glutamate-5-semialdehyde dehydrogenase